MIIIIGNYITGHKLVGGETISFLDKNKDIYVEPSKISLVSNLSEDPSDDVYFVYQPYTSTSEEGYGYLHGKDVIIDGTIWDISNI